MILQQSSVGCQAPRATVKPSHTKVLSITTTRRCRSAGTVFPATFQQQRQLHTRAASRDPEPTDTGDLRPTPPDTTISSSSSSSTGTPGFSSSSSSRPPLRDASDAAIDAVEYTEEAATAAVYQAADTATDAIADAADMAQSAVSDTQRAAGAAISGATDVASAVADDTARAVRSTTADVRTAAEEVASMAAAAVDEVTGGSSPGVDFSGAPGILIDQRFKGMKVLVTGATGGVGRLLTECVGSVLLTFRRVIQALRAKGVACRALVRDTARAANLLPAPTASTASATVGSSSTMTGPEFDIVKGDVFQYSTLPGAMSGCNAVVVCTAANDKSDPFGPFNIDFQGTLNLIAVAKRQGVKRFVFVTSIGADDPFNPLNLFWGILFWKKRAEEELQRSGLSYTIVRPGGLKNKLSSGELQGNIVMDGPNTFGFPPFKRSGSILRSQVADVCVEALVSPAAADKVVEVVAEQSAPAYTLQQLFERV